jgi:exonuclease SbcC
MRPLELTLEGFTSFRNTAKIDFSKLELFAITGPTGAGKSSLLDGMTLALYGEVARGTKPKELLSQGATKLQVSLRFQVDQTEYQVSRIWVYRAKSSQAIFTLHKRQNGEWEPLGEQKEKEITAKIEEILGMNFDTFTKVILLPQGDFDKFLKGKDSERREILKKLAGYTIFGEMREKAERQANILKAECMAIESRFAGLEVPATGELEENRHQHQALKQQIPILDTAFEQARTTLEAEQKLFERIKRLAIIQQELAQLNQQTPEIEKLKQRLEEAQIADRLQGKWELVQEARKQHEKALKTAEDARKNFNEAQEALLIQQENHKEVEAYQAEIEPQLKEREQALNAAKIYEEQRRQVADEVKRLERIVTEKKEALAEKEQDVKKADAKLKKASDDQAKVNQELSQYSPGGIRLEKLNQTAPLLIQWEGIEREAGSDRTNLETAIQQLQAAEQDFQGAVLSLEQAEEAFRQASLALSQAEAHNAMVKQENHASALRDSLKPGDTCSVCGGICPEAHLLPPLANLSLVDIKPLHKRKDEAEKNRKKLQTTKDKSDATLENRKQEEAKCRQAVAERERHLAEVQQQISAVLQEDTWEAAVLKQEHQALQERDAKYNQALNKQQVAVAEFEKTELALKLAQNSFEEARSQHQEATKNVELKKSELQRTLDKLYGLTGNKSYDNLSQELERDKQNLASRINEANQGYQAVRDKFVQTKEALAKAGKDLENASEVQKQRNTNWLANLQEVKFTEELLLKAKALPKEQAKWQKQINDHREREVDLKSRVTQEIEEIGGRKTDQQTITERQEAVRTTGERRKQAQEEFHNLSVWIVQAEDKYKQAKELQEELSTKKKDEETYRTLSKDLQIDKFQAYILEHFEQELVAQATILLRDLTDSRYALKYDKKQYWVEDYWSGGEPRRVETLSGGETFATSLSLALALSEKLSKGAKLGSLFIDEGFGTLDAETLESVAQVLESLREQERLVGVISHVPVLGERLGTEIKVEKYPEGSKIKVEGLVS